MKITALKEIPPAGTTCLAAIKTPKHWRVVVEKRVIAPKTKPLSSSALEVKVIILDNPNAKLKSNLL